MLTRLIAILTGSKKYQILARIHSTKINELASMPNESSSLETLLEALRTMMMRGVPSSYTALQDAVKTDEFKNVCQELEDLFQGGDTNDPAVKKAFLLLCAQRDQENQDTCLSYSASPNSACNLLYWDIAKILFAPSHLGEMLGIIAPRIKKLLKVEVQVSSAQSGSLRDRLEMQLNREPISNLSFYPVEISCLEQMLFSKDLLFCLDQIEKLPLFLHLQLHTLLNASPEWEELQKIFYDHNSNFNQLLFDINWMKQKGTTPDTALTRLRIELTRSAYAGALFAPASAHIACAQFLSYLDYLSEEKRAAVKAILVNLFELLEKESCPAYTADYIKQIQADKKNHAILKQFEPTTSEQRKELVRRYNQPIVMSGHDKTTALPQALKVKNLNQVELRTEDDYIEMLINFPPPEYETLFAHVKILSKPPLPNNLANQMAMLNQEQKSAFANAILKQMEKMGGKRAILKFAIMSGNLDLLIKFSALYRNKKAFLVDLEANLAKDKRYWEWAFELDNPDILKFLLHSFPQQKRLSLMERDIGNGEKLIHLAAIHKNPQFIEIMLADLPTENLRLRVLNQKTTPDGLTPLHVAAENADAEKTAYIILQSLTKQNRQTLIQTRDSYGASPLHRAAMNLNPIFIRLFLKDLPEEDRRLAVHENRWKNKTVFTLAKENPNPDVFATLSGLLKRRYSLRIFEQSVINQFSRPETTQPTKKARRF